DAARDRALRQGGDGMKRRAFLKGSGALVVGVAAAAGSKPFAWFGKPDELMAQPPDRAAINRLDAWIAIAPDGSVTAYTGKCELGHGLFTAQTQLVAEELAVPFANVTLVQCDTALTPDQGTTSGAQSHPTNFNQANLALAGATARETLLQLASKRLAVPVEQLTAKDGVISAGGDASKRVTYGELVGGKKFEVPLNRAAKR